MPVLMSEININCKLIKDGFREKVVTALGPLN
jgi:hypothetical protein